MTKPAKPVKVERRQKRVFILKTSYYCKSPTLSRKSVSKYR